MADDPENIILTDVGRAYLQDRQASGIPARIGSYKLGDTHLFVPTELDINIHGIQTYIGLADEIWWNRYSENEVIVRCICDHDKGDFLIGNIGIYSDTNVLLFIAKFPYIHHKMRSRDDKKSIGGRWTFQLRLIMENIDTLWMFDNLTQRFAEMNDVFLADPTAPKYPLDSFYTELQINDSFLPTNRGGYMNISGDISRKWFTSPYQMSEAWNIVYGRYQLAGGSVGDFHQAIF